MTLDELNDGDQVHVRGVFEEVNGVMWVFAHEIKLQEQEDDTSGVKVTICHIPAGEPRQSEDENRFRRRRGRAFGPRRLLGTLSLDRLQRRDHYASRP